MVWLAVSSCAAEPDAGRPQGPDPDPVLTESTAPDPDPEPVDTGVLDTGTEPGRVLPADAAADRFGGCTGVMAHTDGSIVEYTYDEHGWPIRLLVTGSFWDNLTVYENVVDEDGRMTEATFVRTAPDGSGTAVNGVMVYDEHVHPEASIEDGIQSYTVDNLHDYDEVLRRSTITYDAFPGTYTWTYDRCEMWTEQRFDFGPVGTLIEATNTTAEDCTPIRVEVTVNGSLASVTEFDEVGRPSTVVDQTGSATWTWDCPE